MLHLVDKDFMKNLILISFLFIPFSLFAQSQTGHPQLIVIDPHMDASELKGEFNIQKPRKSSTGLPTKYERDMFFTEHDSKMVGWDELKKDIFFMDLKIKSVTDLHQKYPEFGLKELKEIKGKR